MTVDGVGFGSGTMAGAARVRPGGEAGVQIDDYADAPIKLVTVVAPDEITKLKLLFHVRPLGSPEVAGNNISHLLEIK